MIQSTISIALSVSYGATDVLYPWAYNHAEPRMIRLTGTTPSSDVGAVVAGACYINEVEPAGSAADVLFGLLQRPEISLPAELAFGVQDDRIITTGCCFSLDEWHEWRDYQNRQQQPWGGHDPSPWIETHNATLTIWADGGVSTSDAPNSAYIAPKLPLTQQSYQELMTMLDHDLRGFMQVFHTWVSSQAPHLAAPLSAHFAHLNNLPY